MRFEPACALSLIATWKKAGDGQDRDPAGAGVKGAGAEKQAGIAGIYMVTSMASVTLTFFTFELVALLSFQYTSSYNILQVYANFLPY
jgi:hypothetical protein